MRKYYLMFLIVTILLFIVYQFNQRVVTTMQYFPLDENASINEAATVIKKRSDSNDITWSVHSTSNGPAYLRQDVSLLYANGKFKGILSKWKENVDTITMKQPFQIKHETLLQSISFHHGEVHSSNKITSIQKMTNAEMLMGPDTEEVDEALSELVEQQLSAHWQNLLQYYQLSSSDYKLIPLVNFITYDDAPLPHMTKTATEKVVGQFWEGLYKNYIIDLTTYADKVPSHWMPVILVANDRTHLIVLYEIDGKKHKLRQEIKKEL